MRVFPRHLLLSALAGATRLRRGVALLACVSVLGWTLIAGVHWHDHDDAGSRHHSAAECVLCLSVPTGAAPPEHSLLHLLPPPVSVAVLAPAPRALVSAPRSSYQSRAPPVL